MAVESGIRDRAGAQAPSAPEAQPTEPRASDQSVAPARDTPPSEQAPERERGRDWMREAMQATRAGSPPPQSQVAEAPPASTPASEAERDAKDAPGAQAATDRKKASAPRASPSDRGAAPPPSADGRTTQQITLTQAELDARVARAAQAEADRRLDKFQREEATRRRAAEDRQLRNTDPYAYVQRVEQMEREGAERQQQLEAAQGYARSALTAYDEAVLDPIMKAIPTPEYERIVREIGDGIPGRGQAATEAIKVLRRQAYDAGKQEARKTLLSDQAFVKEVLAKFGGGRAEPEHTPALAGGAAQPFSMNRTIRQMAGRPA